MTCQKQSFSIPEGVHYLNCAYQSPLSKAVEAAGIEGMRGKVDPTRLTVADFFDPAEAVRAQFAQLIGGEAARVAIIPAASYGLATVAKNTPVSRGQKIVLLAGQFPSNVYVWQRLAAENGAHVEFVMPPEGTEGRGRGWNKRLLEAVDETTAIVAIAPLHWTDGTLFDLKQVGTRARDVGAAFVLDGTQAIGALPFDVQEIQPDALICAGYKWLLGPYGLGVGYYGPRYDEGVPLEENWIARKRSEFFAELVNYQPDYQPGARRYDVGERSSFILVPMLRQALSHLLDWGVETISVYCRALTTDLFAQARALGVRIEEETYRTAHLFGLRLPEHLDVERLRAELERRRIYVSVRGDALRIAPHVYNDAEDIAALIEALGAAV